MWLYTGLYFGYPTCCVWGFVRSISANTHFKMYPHEESLNLDYLRCHTCISKGKMTIYPERREEYYAIAQGFHDQDLRLVRREREDVEF